MSYAIWYRKQPFWDYQNQPGEQDDMWLRQLPKIQRRNCGTTQNYYVIKKLTRSTPLKEEFAFVQTSRYTKTIRTKKKGEYDCFHCGKSNHYAYECPQLSERERDELSAIKEKCGRVNTQVGEVVKDNRYVENIISMLVNHKANQHEKLNPSRIYLDN